MPSEGSEERTRGGRNRFRYTHRLAPLKEGHFHFPPSREGQARPVSIIRMNRRAKAYLSKETNHIPWVNVVEAIVHRLLPKRPLDWALRSRPTQHGTEARNP